MVSEKGNNEDPTLSVPLHLHKNVANNDDHPRKPWIITNRIEEGDVKPIFSCSFNPYLPENHVPMLVTVSDRFAHLYSCPFNSNDIKLSGAFHCSSTTESLYASAWCYDTYEYSKKRNPHMIALAGENAIIYIIDAESQHLCNRLTSHGGAINEIRTCPSKPEIIASASKDKTVRIYHIRNDGCLIVIGGPDAHQDQILSLDWSSSGSYIVSCGMDHTIFMWDISTNRPKEIIEKSRKVMMGLGKRNSLPVSAHDHVLRVTSNIDERRDPDPNVRMRLKKNKIDPRFPMEEDLQKTIDILSSVAEGDVYYSLYHPIAKNSDLHLDYVDCVRFLGNTEYIFSKGCGKESIIYMSRFGCLSDVKDTLALFEAETSSVKMMERIVPNGETWFIKFDIDPLKKFLVCGDNRGNVHFWTLRNLEAKEPLFSLNIGNRPIRQVTFGGGGRIIIAVSDEGTVTRLDRVHAGISEIPSFKICSSQGISSKRRREEEDGENDELYELPPAERARYTARTVMRMVLPDDEIAARKMCFAEQN